MSWYNVTQTKTFFFAARVAREASCLIVISMQIGQIWMIRMPWYCNLNNVYDMHGLFSLFFFPLLFPQQQQQQQRYSISGACHFYYHWTKFRLNIRGFFVIPTYRHFIYSILSNNLNGYKEKESRYSRTQKIHSAYHWKNGKRAFIY